MTPSIPPEAVEAAARAYWQLLDVMTPGEMPWDSLPEAGRIEQTEHSRFALNAAFKAMGLREERMDRVETHKTGSVTIPESRLVTDWQEVKDA